MSNGEFWACKPSKDSNDLFKDGHTPNTVSRDRSVNRVCYYVCAFMKLHWNVRFSLCKSILLQVFFVFVSSN